MPRLLGGMGVDVRGAALRPGGRARPQAPHDPAGAPAGPGRGHPAAGAGARRRRPGGTADEGRVRVGRAPARRAGGGRVRQRCGPGARPPRRHPRRLPGRADAGARQPARHLRDPGGLLRGADEVRDGPGGVGPLRPAGPGDRPRRRDPPRRPDPVPEVEEQPRAPRRARSRQDRHRRGPGPAHRQRGRPRRPARTHHLRPGHGAARGRGEVPRRVRGTAAGGAVGGQGRRGPDPAVHRRAAQRRRCRGIRGIDGRRQHAQADARPR